MNNQGNMNSVGLKIYKNPYDDQYVAPYGFHFVRDGINMGKIIWRKPNEIDGIYIERDEED